MSDTADTPRLPDNQVPALPATSSELAQQVDDARANNGDTVRASWAFSLDTIREKISHMKPEAKELLVWAFTWCIDPEHPVHLADFAARVGYDPTTISRIYRGKYVHPTTAAKLDAPEKLLKAMRSFRRLELARAKQGNVEFIHTPTSTRIYWAIDQARQGGRPVIIWGGSQIGKTEACKENCRDFNHGRTILIEIEAVNGLKGILQAIAVKLGVSPNANTPDLITRIKGALTRDMVLIFDEVHLLANVYRKGSFFACMEEIRRIWDATKCGMVFTFTELGYAKAAAERKTELLQIFRRCVFEVNLGACPTTKDVQCFIEAHDLPWDERHIEVEVAKGVADTPYKALKQLATERGITAIIERCRLAHSLAADDGRQSITWADWMRAHFSVLQAAATPKTGWEEVA